MGCSITVQEIKHAVLGWITNVGLIVNQAAPTHKIPNF